MRVFLKCKNCGYENSCATEATSRVEFAMQEGEYKKITCKNCNYSHQYQPKRFLRQNFKSTTNYSSEFFCSGNDIVNI